MAAELSLKDFVVKLAVDPVFRGRFQDPEERDRILADANLPDATKQAMRLSSEGTLYPLLNQEVSLSIARPRSKRATRNTAQVIARGARRNKPGRNI
jgi:hypothetical protein